jgi:hypothetical protein
MRITDEEAAQIGNEISKMENLTSLNLDFS